MNEKIKEIKKRCIKLILLGDKEVGKTSIVNSYLGLEYCEKPLPTLGIDNFIKKYNYIGSSNQRTFTVKIYDSSGDPRFRSIALTSLRICDGIILVYSNDNKESYENIENIWIKTIEEFIDINQKKLILISNKNDSLVENNIISDKEGEELAKKYNIPFFSCSAKMNVNIEEAFNEILKNVCEYCLENEGIKIVQNISLEKKRKKGNYIKQGCFPSPIIAFANMGQAFADAYAEDLEKKKQKKCQIQ